MCGISDPGCYRKGALGCGASLTEGAFHFSKRRTLLSAAVLAAAALERSTHAGSGSYGATNDIGVPWPPAGSPVVAAVYFTQYRKDAKPRDDVVASAARIVANAFG